MFPLEGSLADALAADHAVSPRATTMMHRTRGTGSVRFSSFLVVVAPTIGFRVPKICRPLPFVSGPICSSDLSPLRGAGQAALAERRVRRFSAAHPYTALRTRTVLRSETSRTPAGPNTTARSTRCPRHGGAVQNRRNRPRGPEYPRRSTLHPFLPRRSIAMSRPGPSCT
jgi:hypothetical protein